ncbi:hypothetical protein [uncultured Treponema sp.]|nr:hypothetical protein [uncultured Treponema sp.]
MSALRDLIGQIDNEELKRRITQEVDVLTKQKKSVWFLKNTCRNVRLFMM